MNLHATVSTTFAAEQETHQVHLLVGVSADTPARCWTERLL